MAQLQSGKWDFTLFGNSRFHSVFSLCVLLTDSKEQVNADILFKCAIRQYPRSPFVDFKRCHFLKTNIALVLACTVFEGKLDWTPVPCPSGNEKSLHSLHVTFIFHSSPSYLSDPREIRCLKICPLPLRVW